MKLNSSTAITSFLASPSWSVREKLLASREPNSCTTKIKPPQLHHLLRLAALPAPRNTEHEHTLLKDLQRQLQFVEAIQDIDTTGVAPLICVRDETAQSQKEQKVGLQDPDIQRALAREMPAGRRGRIRTRPIPRPASKETRTDELDNAVSVLQQAEERFGRFVVVDTRRT